MSSRQQYEGDRALGRTQSALAKIQHSGIRADLERFLDGAERCIAASEFVFALEAVRMLVTTVIALDRTIGPDVTQDILEGLGEDSQTTALALQRGLGYSSTRNAKCDIKPFTPPGSSTCVSARNSTCYTLDSGSGCGSSKSRFQFAWDLAAIDN